MITKEIAVTLRVGQELWHNTVVNRDGTPLRCRVNGKCKTWKTREFAFKLPVKHGLKECFYIGTDSESLLEKDWSLPERWAIERHWKEPT